MVEKVICLYFTTTYLHINHVITLTGILLGRETRYLYDSFTRTRFLQTRDNNELYSKSHILDQSHEHLFSAQTCLANVMRYFLPDRLAYSSYLLNSSNSLMLCVISYLIDFLQFIFAK